MGFMGHVISPARNSKHLSTSLFRPSITSTARLSCQWAHQWAWANHLKGTRKNPWVPVVFSSAFWGTMAINVFPKEEGLLWNEDRDNELLGTGIHKATNVSPKVPLWCGHRNPSPACPGGLDSWAGAPPSGHCLGVHQALRPLNPLRLKCHHLTLS